MGSKTKYGLIVEDLGPVGPWRCMRPLPRTFWLQQWSNPNTCVRVLVENGIESEEERAIKTIESHVG